MKRETLFDSFVRYVYKKDKCCNINFLESIFDSLMDLNNIFVNPLTEDETYLVRVKLGIINDSINADCSFFFFKIYHYIEKAHDNRDKLSSLLLYGDSFTDTDVSVIINSLPIEKRNKVIKLLYRNNINTVYDLLTYSKQDLLKIYNIGEEFVLDIIKCLRKKNLMLIEELFVFERKRILLSNFFSDVINNSSFSWLSGMENVYFPSIGVAKRGVKLSKNYSSVIIKLLKRMNITSLSLEFDLLFNSDESEPLIVGVSKYKKICYDYIMEFARNLKYNIDSSKIKIFIDMLFDFSMKNVGLLDETETIIMRLFLIPLYGEKKLNIKKTGIELGYKDAYSFNKLFLTIREKMIYSINGCLLKDNTNRLSTLIIHDKSYLYCNYNLSYLNISQITLIELYKHNIYTLYDLLSYGKIEIINMFKEFKLEYLYELFGIIRRMGFCFADELSYDDKMNAYNKVLSCYKDKDGDYQERFLFLKNNSSVFWLDINDGKKYENVLRELALNYSSIGSLKNRNDDMVISPCVFMSIGIDKLGIFTSHHVYLLKEINIISIYDLITTSKDILFNILNDESVIASIDSFCEYFGLNIGDYSSLNRNVLKLI